uniref:Uncharacterized protein n=1 Tax=Arion vulgaris TaxID=1028688 RepID=A0A0B6ZWN4_9EUPU
MTSSINVLFKVVLLTFIPLCSCRPPLFETDDDAAFVSEQDSPKHLYLPVEIPFDSLLAALRAQSSHLFEKRSSLANEILSPYIPKTEDSVETRGLKRKMFWQPLGYLPASVRAHNSPAGSTGNDNQGSSSNVFRYG